MGYGFKVGGSLQFKATINVQANANENITLKLNNVQVDSKKAGANGYVSFLVKKKGTYTVASSVRSATVSVTQYKGIYSSNIVYVTPATNLTSFGYRTGLAGVYWSDESSYRTGSIVRYSTSNYPTTYNGGSSAFGIGSSKSAIVVSNGNTQYGFTQSISSGTLYWTRFNYLTVNGVTYYSAYDARARHAYTYTSYAGKTTYSTSNNWTIPTGVRSVSMFAMGSGGNGGNGTYANGGGGGGAGYSHTGTYNVTPGQVVSFTIASAQNTVCSLGNVVVGCGGSGATPNAVNGITTGGNGSSGGGASGFRSGSETIHHDGGGNGGANGANGGNAGDGTIITYGGSGNGAGAIVYDGITYGGGGGGGCGNWQDSGGSGGGNGGNGGGYHSNGSDGVHGTGGGGGGGAAYGSTSTTYTGGAGGRGVIIFKYS